MTNTELEEYRRQLQVRQNRYFDTSQRALGTPGGQASVSLPTPDFATNTFQQQLMEEVTAALDRIEKGTFGCCEECGTTIPVGRLEVLLCTRFCVECVWKLQSIKEMKR